LDIHNTSPIISDIQKRCLDIQKVFLISEIIISDIKNSYIRYQKLRMRGELGYFWISEIVILDIKNKYFGYPKLTLIVDIRNNYFGYPEK